MTCKNCERIIAEYLEGALSPPARADFEAHLAACPDCRKRFDEMSGKRLCEGCRVEVFVDVASDSRRRDLVRAIIPRHVVEQSKRVAGVNGERKSLLEGENSAHPPVAEDAIHQFVRAASEPPAAAERQFVNEISHKTLVHIKVRRCPIQFGIVFVQKTLIALSAVANSRRGRFVIKAVRPGVRQLRYQRARAMSQIDVERIVV
ncbi:MAG: anti-sigma factor family protein [Candidatus Acidiferrales bacterium]